MGKGSAYFVIVWIILRIHRQRRIKVKTTGFVVPVVLFLIYREY